MRRRCVSNGATLLLLTFASLGHLAPASLASDAPPHFVLAWGQKGEAEGDLSSPIGVAVEAAGDGITSVAVRLEGVATAAA